jgi:hypothetical protein
MAPDDEQRERDDETGHEPPERRGASPGLHREEREQDRGPEERRAFLRSAREREEDAGEDVVPQPSVEAPELQRRRGEDQEHHGQEIAGGGGPRQRLAGSGLRGEHDGREQRRDRARRALEEAAEQQRRRAVDQEQRAVEQGGVRHSSGAVDERPPERPRRDAEHEPAGYRMSFFEEPDAISGAGVRAEPRLRDEILGHPADEREVVLDEAEPKGPEVRGDRDRRGQEAGPAGEPGRLCGIGGHRRGDYPGKPLIRALD